jgi:hypothetical protein
MATRLKNTFLQRPLLAWASLAVLAYLGHYGGRWVSYAPLQLALTSLSGLIYAACILTSPFFINLAGYLQNRHRNDRLLNAAAIPFLWMTKDIVLLSASHPLRESLYWYFNPMYIFYTCIVLVQIQLASALGRGLLRKQGAYYNCLLIVDGQAVPGS